jgi:hypothetical protein
MQPSTPADLRVILWDIDGTLVRTRRQGVFKDYTTPVLVRAFGALARVERVGDDRLADRRGGSAR